jgi:hypothetical protein
VSSLVVDGVERGKKEENIYIKKKVVWSNNKKWATNSV